MFNFTFVTYFSLLNSFFSVTKRSVRKMSKEGRIIELEFVHSSIRDSQQNSNGSICSPASTISRFSERIKLHEVSEMGMYKKIKEHGNIIPYLHEELIFNILVRLPADVLHKSARYVCKGWANLIRHPRFIEAHLLQANTGLFIESIDSPSRARFFEMKDGEYKMTELKRQFPGRMVASCEGVSLFTDPIDHRALYVANPVTMQVTTLPYLNLPPNPLYYSSSIARISPTGEYKVVHAYEDSHQVCHWLLLTVGVDNSWRKIDCHPAFGSGLVDLECFPVSVGGVVYWIDFDFELDGFNYFLAMDMGDETIHKVPIPSGHTEPCTYLKMGNYLSSFMVNLPATMQFEVQVLKDLRRGEWSKVYMIDMGIRGGIPRNLFCVFPIGWLNNDQTLIFEALTTQGDLLLAYCVKTQDTKIVDLDICGPGFSQIHTNSLVSWSTLTLCNSRKVQALSSSY